SRMPSCARPSGHTSASRGRRRARPATASSRGPARADASAASTSAAILAWRTVPLPIPTTSPAAALHGPAAVPRPPPPLGGPAVICPFLRDVERLQVGVARQVTDPQLPAGEGGGPAAAKRVEDEPAGGGEFADVVGRLAHRLLPGVIVLLL